MKSIEGREVWTWRESWREIERILVIGKPGRYLYQQAVEEIADAAGVSDVELMALAKEMAQAILSGQLRTYDPLTGSLSPEGPPSRPDAYWLVSPRAVNEWLEATDSPYRWNRAHAQAGLTANVRSDKPADPRGTTRPTEFCMTKSALIAAYEDEWPTIRSDIQGASENGLAAAKAGSRGWHEDAALEWARSRNKLKSAVRPANELMQAMHGMANLPARTHKLKG